MERRFNLSKYFIKDGKAVKKERTEQEKQQYTDRLNFALLEKPTASVGVKLIAIEVLLESPLLTPMQRDQLVELYKTLDAIEE